MWTRAIAAGAAMALLAGVAVAAPGGIGGRATCSGNFTITTGQGVAVDPFNQTKTASADECCSFCQEQTSARCNAWTWHQEGMCYVSTSPTPHAAKDTTSGTRASPAPPKPHPKPPLGYQPNFVFVLTDDQDRILGNDNDYTTLGSLEKMAATRQLLVDGGAFFNNAFVATPICCPSRTESFTGRYFHNVHVDKGGCMHVNAAGNVFNASGSMFSLLQAAGYATGVFGKVTNDQGSKYWSPSKHSTWEATGMTHIDSPIEYNDFDTPNYFRKFANGSMSIDKLDPKAPRFGTTYQTAQIGNRTLEWLDEVAGGSQPFFAYIGPHAPHYPAEPAPWHAHVFDSSVKAPRVPNYNVSSPGKAQHIRQNPPLSAEAECWADQHMRDRWASLQAVDDVVREVAAKLEAKGVLDKTFIFYSSDHGYKLGSWRLGTSKQHPFDTDIRVPFLVRGPGVTAGSTPDAIAGNVDVAPTMLDLAGVPQPPFMDGRSVAPIILPSVYGQGASKAVVDGWRDRFLIEYQAVGTYYNDHSSIWHDGNSGPTGTWTCGAGNSGPRGPPGTSGNCVEQAGVGNGTCYFVDSTHSNSWRALRVINAQDNLVYVEYDPTWTWNSTTYQHYELYDLAKDPYQMNNIYSSTPAAKLQELHDSLVAYQGCHGTATTASTCA